MKYENIDEVYNIVNELNKLETNLKDLSSDNLHCSIKKFMNDKEVFSIKTVKEEMDKNAMYFNNMIGQIQLDLKKRIDILKKQLEKL